MMEETNDQDSFMTFGGNIDALIDDMESDGDVTPPRNSIVVKTLLGVQKEVQHHKS